ncbi:MAG: HlyC/CorC family transporter [Chlorobi bacterium]|nr:HlyC/CorC family transporter [Chlorobiota bacterium]
MILELIGLITLLLLSGFFSSSEIAFVVANKLKIELRARKNNLSAKIISYFSEKQQVFFSTILISNNVVNITFASLITLFLHASFNLNDFQILLVSTSLLLLFGELIPKYFAREYPDPIILIAAIPLRIISFFLFPFVKVTSAISEFIVSSANIKEDKISRLFDREDLQTLLHESSTAGRLDDNEYEAINKVIDLGEQKVYEVLTPRTDIVGIEITASVEDAIKIFIESGYSKIPVYEENLDNIKGFIHLMDMFKYPKTIEEVRRDILFVPETKKSLELLNELIDKRHSIAIVVDEFGGTAGIVTIEDIIEEMIGEIRDEHDPDEDVCKKISDDTYIISGKVEIDHLNEEFDLNIPEGEYETIGGYITSRLGNIPAPHEKFEIDNFTIEIIRSSKQRVELIKLLVNP